MNYSFEGYTINDSILELVNYPIVVNMTAAEMDLLIDGSTIQFFAIAWNRMYESNYSQNRASNTIPVVLHFIENQKGELEKIYAVPTHSTQMDFFISGDSQIPAFLSWQHHGLPCQARSICINGDPYSSVDINSLWDIVEEYELYFPTKDIRKQLWENQMQY
jgi:hypothetical protein